MIEDESFNHYADGDFFKTRDEIIFFSDLHADACRFLVLLYKNNLITLGKDFEEKVEKKEKKSIADLLYEELYEPQKEVPMLGKIQWIKSAK